MNDQLKYYLEQSSRSEISEIFSKSFGKSPEEIMKNVRLKMFHPCELKDNLFDYNWPRFHSASDIEKECKKQKWMCGKCREFTLLSVALLRANGIPARSRCGFGIYFSSNGYEDHWVLEYWDYKNEKWQLADAQKKIFNLEVGKFINGAVAWQLFRNYNFSSSLFGFTGLGASCTGEYYLVSNLIRDMKGLLKDEPMYIETLPIMKKNYKLKKHELELLDKISNLILDEDIEELLDLNGKHFS